MAETPLTQGPVSAPAATGQRRPLALLLGGLEWALLLAALGLWAGTRSFNATMSYGSGLLVASWLVRWLRTGRVTRATPLDGGLALFMLSALVGLWAAPNLGIALPRLYLFLGALGLFYALANSEGAGLRLAALGLVGLAAAIGVYFATQHPWAQESVKFAAIRGLGLALNGLVPDLGLYKPHPNVVASVLAVTLPVALALVHEGLRAWRTSRAALAVWVAAAAGLAGVVMLPVVVMTESRAVWLALAAALGLALWWGLAGRLGRERQAALFWSGVGLATASVVGVLAARPHLLTVVLGSLPGPTASAANRLEIFGQVWRLARDTPFTGGGLGAFPALYSTYVLDIPVLLLTHAHNAYLNVLVEQGWPGLAAYALVLGTGAWSATRALAQPGRENRALLGAGAAGLAVVVLQSLADGTLVASRAIPFLFVPVGLVVAARPPWPAARPVPANGRRSLAVAGLAGLAGFAVLAFGWRAGQAAWHANLGAVTYARIELAAWPTGEWNDGSSAAALAAANPEFEAALAVAPDNVTAHYRLGLGARLARDFEAAVAHLEPAHMADPGHRGIRKTLAYSYVWLGQPDRAQNLLAQIPEAASEMDVYVWWWQAQQRRDLAQRARNMGQQLRP